MLKFDALKMSAEKRTKERKIFWKISERKKKWIRGIRKINRSIERIGKSKKKEKSKKKREK